MKVSTIVYPAYQPGLTSGPGLKPHPESRNAFSQGGQALEPAVTPNSLKPTPQISETENRRQKENLANSKGQAKQPETTTSGINNKALTAEEMQILDELKQIDTQVRQHETAHIAAGGSYITSGATFSFQRGPDGNNYAIAGEVSIDSSPVPGDPQATLRKMRQIKHAALAPADPSAQDLKVASKASSTAAKALSELMVLKAKERLSASEGTAFTTPEKAAGSYEEIRDMPKEDTASFQIAV